MEDIDLTILIPSYNHANYVLDCLRQCIDVNVNKEIIIIDDGSVDNTVEIINNFIIDKNNNISLIVKENSGLVSSLNMGLAMAKGRYIYICASDDIPVSKGIEAAYAILNSSDNLRFIFCAPVLLENEVITRHVYGLRHVEFFKLNPMQRYEKCFSSYPGSILIQATIFKTDFLRSIGGWSANIMQDDLALFIKIFETMPEMGRDFKYIKEVVVLYRQHSFNSYKNLMRQFNSVYEVMDKMAPEKLRNFALYDCKAKYIISAIMQKNIYMCGYIITKGGHLNIVRLIYCMFRKICSRIVSS